MNAAAITDERGVNYNYVLLALAGFIISALLYFYFYGSAAPRLFAGSHFINWQNTAICSEKSAPQGCLSTEILSTRPLISIHYQASKEARLKLRVVPVRKNSKPIFTEILSTPTGAWREIFIPVPTDTQLELRIDVLKPGAYFIHPRISTYFDPGWQLPAGAGLAAVILSAAPAAFLLFYVLLVERIEPRQLLLLSFFASLALQLRLSAFFQWDEWDAILKISSQGFGAVFSLHNQHFIPLFFGLIYAQIKLFHDSYLFGIVISHGLHAINAVLIAMLAARFQGKRELSKSSALAGVIFLISLLHGEVLGWWFGQCTIMFLTAVLASTLSGVEYLNTGKGKHLLHCALLAAAAPLSFGNGFSVLVYLPACLAAYLLLYRCRDGWKRFLKIGAVSFLCVAAVGVVYAVLQSGAEHIAKPQPLSALLEEGLQRFAAYIAVGSQAGTVLRGLWILPGYSPGQVYQSFPQSLSALFSPVAYMSLLGLFTTILISALALMCDAKFKRVALLWLLGQILLLSPFFLTALGRWHEETTYALFLRYSYSSLPGLIFIALPLLEQTAHHRLLVGRLLVGAYLAAQLYHGPQYKHVMGYGEAAAQWAGRIRESVLLARESDLKMSQMLADEKSPFAPLPPGHLPSIHRDSGTIFKALSFVNHARYPEK